MSIANPDAGLLYSRLTPREGVNLKPEGRTYANWRLRAVSDGPAGLLRPFGLRVVRLPALPLTKNEQQRSSAMASTTCSIKPVKRSAGRSATAAAAYRAGAEIVDQRTGEVHDYTRKGGVVSAEIVAPDHAPAWAHDREALWNAAELAENRKNAQVAREFLVGLPHELDAEQRQQLAREFAQSLVDRYGFAVDVCIHAPDKDGDQRNHHAHILATTRQMGPDGLTEKTRELDDRTRPTLKNGKKGEARGVIETRWVRQQFEDLTNDHLERAGIDERIDMRSYKDQGLDLEPTQHMGPAATAMERRKPGSTRIDQENQARIRRNAEREHDQILVEVEEFYVEQLEIKQGQVLVEIAQTRAEASRYQRALERLQDVVPDMIRRTLAFMQEHGFAPPESVQKRLEDRGYIKAQEKPQETSQKPLTELERKFQERQDDKDDFDGPGFG